MEYSSRVWYKQEDFVLVSVYKKVKTGLLEICDHIMWHVFRRWLLPQNLLPSFHIGVPKWSRNGEFYRSGKSDPWRIDTSSRFFRMPSIWKLEGSLLNNVLSGIFTDNCLRVLEITHHFGSSMHQLTKVKQNLHFPKAGHVKLNKRRNFVTVVNSYVLYAFSGTQLESIKRHLLAKEI